MKNNNKLLIKYFKNQYSHFVYMIFYNMLKKKKCLKVKQSIFYGFFELLTFLLLNFSNNTINNTRYSFFHKNIIDVKLI